MASRQFLPLVILLKFPCVSFGSNSATLVFYHPMMNNDRGRAQRPSRGKGHGRPPTTFDEAFVAALFDYDILEPIKREVLALEEAESRRGCPMMWSLWNLLARQSKERAQEKAKATRWIAELSAFQSHSFSSLKRLAKDLKIEFSPNVLSPSSPALSPSCSPPISSSFLPITSVLMALLPTIHGWYP